METLRVYRTPILTLDPDAKAGGGMVEVVKAADAQATIAALQAVIRQMGEQAAVLAKDGMAAKAQVAALQRERKQAEQKHLPQYCPVHGMDCRGRRLKVREAK